MKRILMVGVALLTLHALPASAASFTVNFCPGDATCPAGVLEASLTFTDIANADPNDYILDLVIIGSASAPAFVDEVSFTIPGVQTPDGYEALPSLQSFPSTGGTWVPHFDNVNGSATSCTSNAGGSQEVCAESQGAGNNGALLPSQTLTWQFLVDLAGTFALGEGSEVNLRAQFLNAEGGNAGILSPGGGTLTEEPPPPGTSVPEPSSLLLLGAGLIAMAGKRVKS
jgi:hypothetical protein